MKAQGTELYAIDPDSHLLLTIGCITELNGIDTTVEQNEITCLSDLVRRYEPGLATPGAATFGIYTDPKDASHIRLHQLKVAGASIKWAVGWSDKTGTPPTILAGNFVLPDHRSWITFEGFMKTFPFNFAQNAPVKSDIQLQISGEPVLLPRTST